MLTRRRSVVAGMALPAMVLLKGSSTTYTAVLPVIKGAGPELLSAWQYRRQITLRNPYDAPLTNCPTALWLSPENFAFGHARSDGADVRLTDSDGETVLAHWIELWEADRAWLRVKVPSIAAQATKTLWLYYGNPVAMNSSNHAAVYTDSQASSYYEGALISSWRKAESNPILSHTAAWEGTSVVEPTVMYENGSYKMWYRGGNPFSSPLAAIGYATSADGTGWTKRATNPIYSNPTCGLWCPFVTKTGLTYYLYYTAQCLNRTDRANSQDGINFSGQVGNPGGMQLGNRCIWLEGSTWYLLYTWQSNGLWVISLATSANGLTWTPYNGGTPVLSVSGGSVCGPEIRKIGATYYVWTQIASSGCTPTDIYVWRSVDLHTWKRVSPVAELWRSADWERDQVADPCLIDDGVQRLMYYDGVVYAPPNSYDERLGVAVSTQTIQQMASGTGFVGPEEVLFMSGFDPEGAIVALEAYLANSSPTDADDAIALRLVCEAVIELIKRVMQ